MKSSRTLAAAVLLSVALAGGDAAAQESYAQLVAPEQGTPSQPDQAAQPELRGPLMEDENNDPLEGLNRWTFGSALAFDKVVIRPVAYTYGRIVPLAIRDSVRNVINNLNSPVIFANDVLQGEIDRAGVTFLRAFINSTFGIAGLFDIAANYGLPRHYEDFGQTLAVYGVGEGPFLFLPFIGPSNPRDLIGRGVDLIFDPLFVLTWNEDRTAVYARFGMDMLDVRERSMETLDGLEVSSADFYASLRALYRQNREYEIRNGEIVVEDLPDF